MERPDVSVKGIESNILSNESNTARINTAGIKEIAKIVQSTILSAALIAGGLAYEAQAAGFQDPKKKPDQEQTNDGWDDVEEKRQEVMDAKQAEIEKMENEKAAKRRQELQDKLRALNEKAEREAKAKAGNNSDMNTHISASMDAGPAKEDLAKLITIAKPKNVREINTLLGEIHVIAANLNPEVLKYSRNNLLGGFDGRNIVLPLEKEDPKTGKKSYILIVADMKEKNPVEHMTILLNAKDPIYKGKDLTIDFTNGNGDTGIAARYNANNFLDSKIGPNTWGRGAGAGNTIQNGYQAATMVNEASSSKYGDSGSAVSK